VEDLWGAQEHGTNSMFNGGILGFRVGYGEWKGQLNSSRIQTVVMDSSFTPFLNALNVDRVYPTYQKCLSQPKYHESNPENRNMFLNLINLDQYRT
jgi:hypothetical protein